MTTVSNEIAKLLASDGAANDKFGTSVSVSGNFAIVSSPFKTSTQGRVYIFEYVNSTWTEKQILLASDKANDDLFGISVGISGNYAIIGAHGNDDNGSISGSAYIFEYDGSTWIEKQKLLASDGGANDRFGESVNIDGNYAIVGAHAYDGPNADGNSGEEGDMGAAYVYERDVNGNWTEKQILVPPNPSNRNSFGYSVSISGTYAIIGGAYKNGYSGSAYIFEYNGTTWILKKEIVKITNSNDWFGYSVSISGNYAIVGSYGDNSNRGAAFIYERDVNGVWTEKHKLVSSDIGTGDLLGYSVAINNNYAIVGAIGDDDMNSGAGAVYLFKLGSDGNWSETKKLLATDGQSSDYLGYSVALDDNFIITGARENDTNGSKSGAAYIFELGPSVSSEEQSLIDLNIESTDIDVIKAVTFSNKSNGKGNADTTSIAKVKSILNSAADANDKRRKRRATLKLLFSQDTDITKMVIPKADLELPDGFKKTNALVVKAGESFNISELGADEGFYSVLDDGESVDIVTENTTLTFTRNDDVNDNELYEVSAADWTDIVINSDNVSSGTFTDSNNTGTLAPDDSVTIDGRVFIIGSVADGGAGGSGGDPYVFPLKSNTPVKLPNKPAVYRMFEQGDNYVNVEVGKATDEHKQRMFMYASQITPVTHNIVMDGYFYQKAFISAEGHKLTLDYRSRKAETDEISMKFFSMKQSKKHFDCGEFKEDANCWTVGWTTKENKKIQVQLMFFPNPHIENGINVIPSTLKNSTGLIVDNFKPKLMELPSLTTEKFSKLHRKLSKAKNIHQKMSIKNKNEKWHFN